MTLDCKYVCGSACLYNLLGILCSLLYQEDKFPCPLVMKEWTGFTFPVLSFSEHETFGWGGPSFMEKGSLVRFSIWGGFLFSPKSLSKLKLNLVS